MVQSFVVVCTVCGRSDCCYAFIITQIVFFCTAMRELKIVTETTKIIISDDGMTFITVWCFIF